MTRQDLMALAIIELTSYEPAVWNARAKQSFTEKAKGGGCVEDEVFLDGIWKDAIEETKITRPDSYAKYKNLKTQLLNDPTVVKWEEIKCLGGKSNGDHIVLQLRVRNEEITLEGSDVELCSPDWVHRKLQVYTNQSIDFPFHPRNKQEWFSVGLRPWLNHENMIRAKRESTESLIIDSLRRFCREPISAESDPSCWGSAD